MPFGTERRKNNHRICSVGSCGGMTKQQARSQSMTQYTKMTADYTGQDKEGA